MNTKTTHERLVELWDKATDIKGSKARKLEAMGHIYTTVLYIVKTPTYEDESKMELIIQCLKQIISENKDSAEKLHLEAQAV